MQSEGLIRGQLYIWRHMAAILKLLESFSLQEQTSSNETPTTSYQSIAQKGTTS